MKKSQNNEELILNLFKKDKAGFTITEIVNLSKLSRSTVRVALAKLEGSGRVDIRNIGMAKLYRLRVRK